ncbi:hypothetical protein SUGI_0886370 [Cryptomeria japonica]|uniref:uncharacterized protein LOC131061409 n=1 Tax=Cryptomeria japonica TaxID=3369 RepID=UPI0024148A90|nr:uncharacterized protein LOC131061409 [Cryptomeria japonica]GLJ42749.1 hypothetical protein SUGI_0886370 [Cryptomeria japonica]
MYQIFVKGLDGKTKCLQISTPNLRVSDLKKKIFESVNIPHHFQLLVSGTRQIAEDTLLVAADDGFYPPINVLLRLRGGKGGFGSLLRGAATKAGQKKTSNFDACRDMSGRRLRHVNAEKKLEEWKAEAQERQLEKVAEEYLKKQVKKGKGKKGGKEIDEGAVDVEKYRSEAERAMVGVESAVKDGLLEALRVRQKGKRKIIEVSMSVTTKRSKLWMLEEDEDEDKDGEVDEEIEEWKQEACLMKVNEESGSSHTSNAVSASDSGIASVLSNGKSETVSCDDVSPQQICNATSINDNCCDDREADVEPKKYESISFSGENCSSPGGRENSIESKEEMPFPLNLREEQNITCLNSDREPNVELKMENTKSSLGEDDNSCDDKEATSGSTAIITDECGEKGSIYASNDSIGESLEFDEFNTPKDIERLGLERLKNELQSRGLKCGGSLSERAARLFLLKTTPLEKLHKKHFAKAKDVGR